MNYVLRVTKAIIAPGLHTGLVNIPLLCGILEATRSRKKKNMRIDTGYVYFSL